MYSIGDKVAPAASPSMLGTIVKFDGGRPLVVTVEFEIPGTEKTYERIYLEEHLIAEENITELDLLQEKEREG